MSNRDESIHRIPPAIPAWYDTNKTRIEYPKDIKGGTWIGRTDHEVVILLNGGFKNHVKQSDYKHSRGIVVLDFLSAKEKHEIWNLKYLTGLEPFTLVYFSIKEGLFEYVWDGSMLYNKKVDMMKPYCWLSSTLYSREEHAERLEALNLLWNEDKTITALNDFHRKYPYESLKYGKPIDFIKTVSCSFVEIQNQSVSNIQYEAFYKFPKS